MHLTFGQEASRERVPNVRCATLATFNVENLFVRARALNLASWAESKNSLEQYVALSQLIEQPAYTNEIKAKMIELLAALGIDKRNDSRFVLLRENRG